MNILLVSEAFVGGGLETHIHTYYQELCKDHKFVFAFGRFKNRLPIREDDVHDGFHFKWESTIQELIEDVNGLCDLIQKEKIDVIHVHPFFSIYPALIASQLTGVPIAITYHGIASFSFSNRIIDTIWYYYGMYELFGKIFTVSNTGKKALMRQFNRNDICFLPNAVDLDQYRRHHVIDNRCWAVISRLDGDNGKEEALVSLFGLLPHLDIDHIDIYGDGTRKKALMDYVQRNNLSHKVTFMGFQSDLFERLDGRYNGIIGTDRVAIEGLAMGYPVLEMGYGRVIGCIDAAMLEKLRDINFDANLLMPIAGAEELNRQLTSVYQNPALYDMRSIMERDFNIKNIGLDYIRELKNIPFLPHANVCEFYRELCAVENRNENFFRSDVVFSLMKKYVEYYAVSSDIKILFLIQQMDTATKAQMINHVNGLNWRIDQCAETFGERIAMPQTENRPSLLKRIVWKMKRVAKKILKM